MANKKREAKRPWTQAEVHYLKAQAATDDVDALAVGTGRALSEVDEKLLELGLTPEKRAEAAAKRRRKKGLAGFAVGSESNPNAGVVAMTGGRSLRDDAREGHGPSPTKVTENRADNALAKHRASIWRG